MSTSPDVELIRLRNAEGLIDYLDTPETEGMRNRLRTFNEFQEEHWLDLCVPDAEFRLTLQSQDNNEATLSGKEAIHDLLVSISHTDDFTVFSIMRGLISEIGSMVDGGNSCPST